MTCYIVGNKPPSSTEFQRWRDVGYTGSYADYVRVKKESENDPPMIVCGDLGPHCAECLSPGDVLCDYPVRDGKTCDRTICEDHAHQVYPDIHYCAAHYKEWMAFKSSNAAAALAASVPIANININDGANDDLTGF